MERTVKDVIKELNEIKIALEWIEYAELKNDASDKAKNYNSSYNVVGIIRSELYKREEQLNNSKVT